LPRYFFDIDDERTSTRDEVGVEISSLGEMRRQAVGALPDIARDRPWEGDRRSFIVRVRDERGRRLFQASLVLESRWLDGKSV
jgi:hypothetical protein